MTLKGDHLTDKDATLEVVQRDEIGMAKIGLAKEDSSQKSITHPNRPLWRSKLFCTITIKYKKIHIWDFVTIMSIVT